jgi:hypothetical protein
MRKANAVEDEPYDEESGAVRALREGARIVVMSLIVTAVIGGGYLMVYGRGGALAQVASGQTGKSTNAPATHPTSTPSPTATAAPSFADQVQAALAKLPQGTLDTTARRTALLAYDTAIGLDFGPTGSPATAAANACSLLAGGTVPDDLVTGVADGAKLSDDQARAFLRGASTLYCPKYAGQF